MKEGVTEAHLQWLGGIFSVGGNVGFQRTLSKGRPHFYPKMIVEDKDYSHVSDVKRYFDGTLSTHRRGHRLQLIGNRVAEIIVAFSDYAPTRQGVAKTMRSWNDLPLAQRQQLAKEEPLSQRQATTVENYKELVCLPAFVTGVLHLRGPKRYFFSVEQGKWLLRDIVLTTTDLNLLTALQGRFGGNMPVNEAAAIKAPNSHKLYFDTTESRKIASFTADFQQSL